VGGVSGVRRSRGGGGGGGGGVALLRFAHLLDGRLVADAERLIDPRDQEAVPRLQRHGAGLALAVARRCCRRREHGVPL